MKANHSIARLRRSAGSLLVVGLQGTQLTGLEGAWLKVVRPAGIILFRRNISDARQTRSLLSEATALCETNSLRCVDVEGGTVDRLRDALAPIPSAQEVARAGMKFARLHGDLVAQAVRAFGFNTTLAPVLDLGLPESVVVMGTRSASASATEVSEYARAFLDGLSAHNVAGCGKHFPGLGAGTRDSHLETPAIQRDMRELWRDDLAPYRALRRRLPMVMVNHATYLATPGKARPASVSSYWISTVLRKRIGYNGVVFSDDLEMGGILNFMSIEEAVIASVRAGMDLMEICHSPELILSAYEALVAEGERSKSFAELLAARARRTARLRAALFAGTIPPPLTAPRFEALRARILQFAQTIARSQPASEDRIA
jgi:beta-N-acetylhexosaminidase